MQALRGLFENCRFEGLLWSEWRTYRVCYEDGIINSLNQRPLRCELNKVSLRKEFCCISLTERVFLMYSNM